MSDAVRVGVTEREGVCVRDGEPLVDRVSLCEDVCVSDTVNDGVSVREGVWVPDGVWACERVSLCDGEFERVPLCVGVEDRVIERVWDGVVVSVGL